jgi:hypothetical protein
MHTSYNRRTATKIKDGRVQRKNRHVPTGKLGCIIDRESPGRGFRHVLTKNDVQEFLSIIPDRDILIEGLERIILARNDEETHCDGYYLFYHREETGGVFLHAWREDLWAEIETGYFESHEEIFTILGVSFDRSNGGIMCRFTEAQARAFMLLHVLMHELGHHYDRRRQKHRHSSRGEDYAERFANTRFYELYARYVNVFGNPAREEN